MARALGSAYRVEARVNETRRGTGIELRRIRIRTPSRRARGLGEAGLVLVVLQRLIGLAPRQVPESSVARLWAWHLLERHGSVLRDTQHAVHEVGVFEPRDDPAQKVEL